MASPTRLPTLENSAFLDFVTMLNFMAWYSSNSSNQAKEKNPSKSTVRCRRGKPAPEASQQSAPPKSLTLKKLLEWPLISNVITCISCSHYYTCSKRQVSFLTVKMTQFCYRLCNDVSLKRYKNTFLLFLKVQSHKRDLKH